MTKPEILEKLYKDSNVNSFIIQITSDQYYREEIKSELFLILAEKEEEQLKEIYKAGKMQGYIIGIIQRMFNSKSHEFSKKVKIPRKLTQELEITFDRQEPDDNYHQLLTNTEKAVTELHPADKVIFDYLVQGKTIKEISQLTKVNRQYISQMIKRIRKELKNKIRKDL